MQRTGLVLLALTPESELKMQLRLFVLEEVSPRPRLHSLIKLSRELEFFFGASRHQSIVREVFDRTRRPAGAAGGGTVGAPPAARPAPAEASAVGGGGTGVSRAGTRLDLLFWAAAGIAWSWPRLQGRWLREGVALGLDGLRPP